MGWREDLALLALARAGAAQADADAALARRSILVKLAAAQTTADYSTAAAIPFDTIVENTGGFTLSAGGIVIPAGVSRIVAKFRPVVSSLTAGEAVAYAIYKDAAALDPTVSTTLTTSATAIAPPPIASYEFPVVAGSVITGVIDTPADASITVGAASWLEVVAIP